MFIYAYFAIRWYNTGDVSPFPIPIAAADSSIDEAPVTVEQISQHMVPPKQPRYISIPSLSISNTRVISVGVTADNNLDVPKNINDAAWYKESITPGSGHGAVLIDGHNGGVTRNGIFSNLSKLAPGDIIKIVRGDDKVYHYKVYDVRVKPLDWVNTIGMKEMVQSVDLTKEGLNLITCAGKWIPRETVFDHRVLVRATIVN